MDIVCRISSLTTLYTFYRYTEKLLLVSVHAGYFCKPFSLFLNLFYFYFTMDLKGQGSDRGQEAEDRGHDPTRKSQPSLTKF